MHRSLSLTDLFGICFAGLAVYKVVEIGPYEASLLAGRCFRIFVSAMQGYI